MTSIADGSIIIQTSSESVPSPSAVLANRTQQETPLLDRICGEGTITDLTHALYSQTLSQILMRIKRRMPGVMVLLPSGRHMVPRTATNLDGCLACCSLAFDLGSDYSSASTPGAATQAGQGGKLCRADSINHLPNRSQ